MESCIYSLLSEIYYYKNDKNEDNDAVVECMISTLMGDKCTLIKNILDKHIGIEGIHVVDSGLNNSAIIHENKNNKNRVTACILPTFQENTATRRVLNNRKIDAGPFVTVYRQRKFSTTGNDPTMTIMGLSIMSSMLTSVVVNRYSISIPYTHYMILKYDQVMQALVVELPDGYRFRSGMEIDMCDLLSKNPRFSAPYFKYTEGNYTVNLSFFETKFTVTGVTAPSYVIVNALDKCFSNNRMNSMIQKVDNTPDNVKTKNKDTKRPKRKAISDK